MNNNKNQNPINSRNETSKPKKNLTFILLALFFGLLFIYFMKENDVGDWNKREINYSEFLVLLDNQNLEWNNLEIVERNIKGNFSIKNGIDKSDSNFLYNKYHQFLLYKNEKNMDEFAIWTYSPYQVSDSLIQKLQEKKISFKGEPQSKSYFQEILIQLIPFAIILGLLWFFLFRQIQSTGNRALSFGKNRAKLFKPDKSKLTFDDVAGAVEAKEELKETVEFLKFSEKFKKIGAKIPKGILLIGPPGTGKTLLAKSVAGEANCPFFSMSGSDFVEMFVGVGASRVRDLFEQGKKHSPCILFIDELDAVGRIRGAGYGGGHDEREQTLNQMLVEMDGFNTDATVIVIAATNRPDVLDPALLRPGRFDRRVMVSSPDVKGREAILKIHAKKIPLDEVVDFKIIARGTPGLSGADLANLMNEAALIAARYDKEKVDMEDLEYAKDKVIMGPERKSLFLSQKEKENTAYHEAGHAILAYLLPKVNSLHKVSIVPRGNALGITQMFPQEERLTLTKDHLMEEIMVLFGGRIGEDYHFKNGGITNGASNDIERATKIARAMVCEWGMSDNIGPINYGQREEPIFLGKEIARHKDYSEKTAENIDFEIKQIINKTFKKAYSLVMKNIDSLEKIAKALLKKEVLNRKDINLILK